MAGEKILLIDSSAGVQELAKAVMEEHGYRVTCASNGVAALAHPELDKFSLVLLDTNLDGIDGLETVTQIRTDAETFGVPVLMLIPESDNDARQSPTLRGANGFLCKPFTPAQLTIKVDETLKEKKLRDQSQQYLEESADRHMQALAEQKIQQAVEKKIQIIVERAIQSIVSIIDQRTRREVDARVTALTTEKEQELVRLTVQEVARSMVEKMAERKVTEAMEAILVETTEKTVKRVADAMLPAMIRERMKESLENMVPREVQLKVEKATQDKMAEFSEALVSVLQTEAKKTVPLVAKEKLPEIAERQVLQACEQRIPALVNAEARGAVGNELNLRIKPMMDAELTKLRKVFMTWLLIITALIFVVVVCTVFFGYQYIKAQMGT